MTIMSPEVRIAHALEGNFWVMAIHAFGALVLLGGRGCEYERCFLKSLSVL